MSVLYLIIQDKTYILSRHIGMQYAESIFEENIHWILNQIKMNVTFQSEMQLSE